MPTSAYDDPPRAATRDISPIGEDLRSAMRLFPTGVALLTAGEGAQATAMTINALMSVSLAPPQILVSVLRTARAHPVLEHTGAFGAHLLADDQAAVARLFASPDKPSGAELWGFLCRHVLPGTLASMSCTVRAVYAGGDHSLFLGGVERVRTRAAGRTPLVFHHGALGGGPGRASSVIPEHAAPADAW